MVSETFFDNSMEDRGTASLELPIIFLAHNCLGRQLQGNRSIAGVVKILGKEPKDGPLTH